MEREHECEYKEAFLELKAQVALLLGEVAALKSELAKYRKPPKDSSNSSIGPSQDLRRYPKREKSSRERGGQTGHKGSHHPLSNEPDCIEAFYANACGHCGSQDLEGLAAYGEVRQVVDLAQLRSCTREYRQHLSRCRACGKTSRGKFPKDVQAPVQMGAQARSLVGYLKVVHHLSHQRIEQAFEDLFGISVSRGWINTHLQEMAKKLSPQYEAIGEALKHQVVVGSDETGNWINGKRGYLWVFQTSKLCLFFSTPSRGFKVIENILGRQSFSGTWVSDRYGAQLKVAGAHQLCLAHLIRECKYLMEAESSLWAEQLKTLFQQAIAYRNQQAQPFYPTTAESFRQIQAFKQDLEVLFSKPPPQTGERKLFEGLLYRQHQLLVFLENPAVPPTNNDSERALRNRVIHRKLSGGFRGFIGSRCHDIIASLVETAKRQNLNILDVLSLNSLTAIPVNS